MVRRKIAAQDADSKTMVVVLGDQLTPGLSSLAAADRERAIVVMAEIIEETAYAPHHKKKLVFVLSSMRHFAEALRAEGWTVDFESLTRHPPYQSFNEFVVDKARKHAPQRILATEAGEFRVRTMMEGWEALTGVPTTILDDDRFLMTPRAFAAFAEGRKGLRLEHFYRAMRVKTGLLMEGDHPVGGRWNFDAENRKSPPREPVRIAPPRFAPDRTTEDVLHLVRTRFERNFGAAEPFWLATTRKDAERARDHFFDHALASFGDYQDAMLAESKFLYHAVLSPYLNIGFLDPLDLCIRAEAALREGRAPLNAVEGFIRQIIGWREYVRGVYFLGGPDYPRSNRLGAARALPWFYWSGETDMFCIRTVVEQTREEAYAHHVQRLMVTGNFALLAGVDPYEVHVWYLAVYADAYEWVEAPNTVGMSQYADGGVMASKPYAASGAYINRMSDYCGRCRYDWKKKVGPDACPFNALYWDFFARHEKRLAGNRRLAGPYATLARMEPAARAALREQAAETLARLDRGDRV